MIDDDYEMLPFLPQRDLTCTLVALAVPRKAASFQEATVAIASISLPP